MEKTKSLFNPNNAPTRIDVHQEITVTANYDSETLETDVPTQEVTDTMFESDSINSCLSGLVELLEESDRVKNFAWDTAAERLREGNKARAVQWLDICSEAALMGMTEKEKRIALG